MAPKAEKPPKKVNILDDSGSDDEDGGAALAAPQLKVNEEYARRFEHNKKREERQRCMQNSPLRVKTQLHDSFC